MIAIGRRIITLDDPPGATVTIGPWELAEFLAWLKLDPADPLTPAGMWDVFATHIEKHPFDVADLRELDGVAIVAIVNAWTKMMSTSPPLRGPRASRPRRHGARLRRPRDGMGIAPSRARPDR